MTKEPQAITVREALADKVADLKEAKAAIVARLMVLYPQGARFRFNLRPGQKAPSVGTVVGWNGGEKCLVCFKVEPKDSRGGYRTSRSRKFTAVAMADIVGPAE